MRRRAKCKFLKNASAAGTPQGYQSDRPKPILTNRPWATNDEKTSLYYETIMRRANRTKTSDGFWNPWARSASSTCGMLATKASSARPRLRQSSHIAVPTYYETWDRNGGPSAVGRMKCMLFTLIGDHVL